MTTDPKYVGICSLHKIITDYLLADTDDSSPFAAELKRAALFFDTFASSHMTDVIDAAINGKIECSDSERVDEVAAELEFLTGNGFFFNFEANGCAGDFDFCGRNSTDETKQSTLTLLKLMERQAEAYRALVSQGIFELKDVPSEFMKFVPSNSLLLPPLRLETFAPSRISEFISDLDAVMDVIRESNTARYYRNAGYSAAPINTEEAGGRGTNVYQNISRFGLQHEIELANVYGVLLKKVSMPAASVSWHDIMAFRKEDETQYRLRKLRVWISDAAKGTVPQHEIQEQIEDLLADHERYLRNSGIATTAEIVEFLAVGAAEVIEDLLKLRLRKLTSRAFALIRQRADVRTSELTAPGRELSFIIHARSAFHAKST